MFIRIVGILLLAIVLVTLLRVFLGGLLKLLRTSSAPPPHGQQDPPQPQGGTLHRDPHCGVFVAEGAAIQAEIRGVTYYFCSDQCRRAFQETGKSQRAG